MQPIPTGLVFLVSFVMGFLALYIAKRKEKNPYLWFFCGFFFGLLGVLFLYFLPVKKQKEKTVEIRPTVDPLAHTIWYYLDEEMKQTGPVSYAILKKAQAEGVITGSTYVWNPDLDDWKTAEEILPKTTS